MPSVEICLTGQESLIGTATVKAAMNGAIMAGMNVRLSNKYEGTSQWLCMYGVGSQPRDRYRHQHIAKGGRVACFDLGYFSGGKDREKSYVRVSIDHNHPHRELDVTPNTPDRFKVHGIKLREAYDPDGPVIVVGIGPKSRIHLNLWDWEIGKLNEAKKRFPNRRIIYRPKPYGLTDTDKHVSWQPRDWTTPVQDLLTGASLVITRHSNVGIDACIAGIPCEAEDGAALWVYPKSREMPSREKRLDFLYRLAHWQYRLGEMQQCWLFLNEIIKRS